MKKQLFLSDYREVADSHANKLRQALVVVDTLIPLTIRTLKTAAIEQIALLDMVTTRFGKLQDVMGAHIFPLLLEQLGEINVPSFIDKLNRLEKLHYIDDAQWWMDLRTLRNEMAHEYPNDESVCDKFNAFIPKAYELLEYWDALKQKIKP